MGTNTFFRLVLVFDYCIIGLDKTCNDIFQTGLMKSLWLNQAPPSSGFFVYGHLGLVDIEPTGPYFIKRIIKVAKK